MKRLGYFVPLAVLLAIGMIFVFGLGDSNKVGLDNALADQAVPAFPETVLDGFAGVDDAATIIANHDLTLVNYFASWCAPCRAEHPQLTALAERGVAIIGINYKDEEAKAKGFIAELGNPYKRIYTDTTGRTAIDWGVSGVPETFFVNREGVIIDRFFGPITAAALAEKLDALGILLPS